MKKSSIVLIICYFFSGTLYLQAQAHEVEYDDLYFSAKDRKAIKQAKKQKRQALKEKTTQTKLNQRNNHSGYDNYSKPRISMFHNGFLNYPHTSGGYLFSGSFLPNLYIAQYQNYNFANQLGWSNNAYLAHRSFMMNYNGNYGVFPTYNREKYLILEKGKHELKTTRGARNTRSSTVKRTNFKVNTPKRKHKRIGTRSRTTPNISQKRHKDWNNSNVNGRGRTKGSNWSNGGNQLNTRTRSTNNTYRTNKRKQTNSSNRSRTRGRR